MPRTKSKELKAASEAKLKTLLSNVKVDHRWVKRLRKLGASNYEIAIALGIPENSPALQE